MADDADLFRADAYAKTCTARVVAADDGAIVLDRTVFYPTGGGQPGDTGTLTWDGGAVAIVDTIKGGGGGVVHVPAPGAALPPAGMAVEAAIDWDRRYRHMRMHTTMHLLCSIIPADVTGGQVGADKSRLDFNLPGQPLDKAEIQAALDQRIAAGHPVAVLWIDEDELARRPELVRTLSVKPPVGSGRVRLVCIGPQNNPVDLQPCGGTHVANTTEIGLVAVGKIENKGKQNRRVSITLAD